MGTTPRSRLNPGEYQHVTGLIEQHGWPLTKASSVLALEFPDFPTFPLDAETLAQIPDDVPGDLPTSLDELHFESKLPPPRRRRRQGTAASMRPVPEAERRLPPEMVTLAAERHGMTYEQAEQELKNWGG